MLNVNDQQYRVVMYLWNTAHYGAGSNWQPYITAYEWLVQHYEAQGSTCARHTVNS